MGYVQGPAEGDENMSEILGLKAKLGLDVFKHDKEPHIKIKPGMEKDPRLKERYWYVRLVYMKKKKTEEWN